MRWVETFVNFIVILLPSFCYAANVTIVKPADGSLYRPGDSIEVQVNAPEGSMVLVLAEGGISFAEPMSGWPYVFKGSIPDNISAGTYTLSAIAKEDGATSKTLPTARTRLIVEPGVPKKSATLEVSPGLAYFKYEGQKMTVNVYLNNNGVTTNVSGSTRLKAVSADQAIVSANGVRLAAGKRGESTVTFTLDGISAVLPVENIASDMRGDLNGDGRVDIDDRNIIKEALGKVANDKDARDLNRDGKIDAADMRALTGLCAYHKCATHL